MLFHTITLFFMERCIIFYAVKTTLDIPEEMLAEEMKVCGARTKREAVLRALDDFNTRAKLRKLSERLGRSKTFMDFDELMKLRVRGMPGKSDIQP